MAIATVSGVRIAGMASAVPTDISTVPDMAQVFGDESAQKISENTGVVTRRIAAPDVCTSDLCEAATHGLLSDLRWSPDSVDLVVFVSQTPDYRLPATACVLHGKLGLAKTCAAFDVNLGCSGYVYGLWMAGRLMESGSIRRALLMVGDTGTHSVSPLDRSAAPLFGDAASVTALEVDPQASPMVFELGTDGTGAQDLIIPAGGYRMPSTSTTCVRSEREGSNIRSDEDLYMNGTEIFTFTLREVPSMVKQALEQAGWQMDDVDAFVFHQANRFILNHLVKRMKIASDKVPLSIDIFGNTSSASIPITMTERLSDTLKTQSMKLVLAGFGVGLSWAAATVECGPIVISDLVSVSGA